VEVIIMKFLQLMARLALMCLFIFKSSSAASPQFGKVRGSTEAEDETKQLVVMIDYQLGGEDRFGSGIIFGVRDRQLLIFTANHVVREGKQEIKEAQNILVQIKSLPGKQFAGRLLPDRDVELDLAVIIVENLEKTNLQVDALPFDRVGDPKAIKRGDLLYSLGYPNKKMWRMNFQPDVMAEASGNMLDYESNFIAVGHSGGALLDQSFDLIGMIRSDQPPYGEAVSLDAIMARLRQWNYPISLGTPPGPMNFVSVVSGGDFACALTARGVTYCWGANGSSAALGNGTTSGRPGVKRVIGGFIFSSLTAGGDHACGITVEGTAYCWGSNIWGELGNGSQDNESYVPVMVSGNLKFLSLSAGEFTTCGVTVKSEGYCWGSQNRHERVPVPLPGGTGLNSLAVGSTRICGSGKNGAINCWVIEPAGKSYSLPSAVAGEISLTALSLDFSESSVNCGMTTSGEAYCWGENDHGELGNGHGGDETTSANKSDQPVPVSGRLNFKLLTVGYAFACGITKNGAAYCWGLNDLGQLGDGTHKNNNVPVPVRGGLGFVSLSASRHFTCGVVSGGTLYCWGDNESGQLGNGSPTASSVPQPVIVSLK
jgi:alpha-tubulin suppressor-like RCC1 family protein